MKKKIKKGSTHNTGKTRQLKSSNYYPERNLGRYCNVQKVKNKIAKIEQLKDTTLAKR